MYHRKSLLELPTDDFWTLVAYHNSRRELGKTQTLARDDIPARIQQIAASYDHTDEEEVPAEVQDLLQQNIMKNLENFLRIE